MGDRTNCVSSDDPIKPCRGTIARYHNHNVMMIPSTK